MAVMSITFGGVNSADYGIYIGGEGTFNAPERDVEVVSVPGRNGNLIIDNGRFQNIEVKYSAINQEPDLATFAANLEAFRNAIASQKGYQRLTDTFHPDEYRMATFRSGLEINPIEYNTASEFEIVFDCKPQRFLTSGETSEEITNGGTITNPTAFESSPFLEIEGYGDINIEGQPITINNQPIGEVLLKNKQTNAYYIIEIDTANLEPGDTITIKSLTFYLWWYDTISITLAEGEPGDLNAYGIDKSDKEWGVRYVWPKRIIPTFTKGTSFSQSWDVEYTIGDSTGRYVGVFRFTLSYDGNNTIRFYYATVSYTHTGTKAVKYSLSRDVGAIYGESTMPTLGNPIYCDLDIGEAYKYVDGEAVSVNSGVVFPAVLPTLKPGLNTITYDNTITSLDVTPRWWKI